jgi:hypothetical protein
MSAPIMNGEPRTSFREGDGYDAGCYDLAHDFVIDQYPGAGHDKRLADAAAEELAQLIQNTIEAYLNKAGAP